MSSMPLPFRVFKEAQKEGRQWLSPSYSIELATESDLLKADALYDSIKDSTEFTTYFRDYVEFVGKISEDTYCDIKYLIKDKGGSIVGYFGLETDSAGTILSFVQIPLTTTYDPLTTLLLKVWLFYHDDYIKVYYTMRHNLIKRPPIDKYLKVIPLGAINPSHPTHNIRRSFYFKTIKGGAIDPFNSDQLA